jgi:hypothetical protein
MTSQDSNGVQIDQIHTGAICKEIGERLRGTLTGNPNQLPPHLRGLMERFDSVERGSAAFKSSIGMDAR